jgi:hypothetical protein
LQEASRKDSHLKCKKHEQENFASVPCHLEKNLLLPEFVLEGGREEKEQLWRRKGDRRSEITGKTRIGVSQQQAENLCNAASS